jgi:hypothetical protein
VGIDPPHAHFGQLFEYVIFYSGSRALHVDQ